MITRVWKGPELEGFSKGIITLFVEGVIVDGLEVCKYLNENTDCKRVYLGAGGKGLTCISNTSDLITYCQRYNISIIVELIMGQLYLCNSDLLENSHVILTCNGYESNLINEFKTDDNKIVNVYDLENGNIESTDLSTLHNGLYEVDELLYKAEAQ